MKATRLQIAGVAAATLVGAGLRLHHIGRLSLWFDEGYTAWAIDHSPREIIRLIRADTAPPLYYLLLYVWSILWGTSEVALRSFSAIIGIATIPLVAATTASVGWAYPPTTKADRPSRWASTRLLPVAAAWLVTLNFLQTWYSQEARGYELACFLAVLTLFAVARHLAAPAIRWLALAVASAAAAMYVNNFMILYLPAIAAAGLVLPGAAATRRRLRDLAIGAACIALLYAPFIAALVSQIHRVNAGFWIEPPTLASVSTVLARTAGVDHFWTWDQYLHPIFPNTEADVPRAAAFALLAAVAAAAIFLRGDNRRAALGIAVAALLPPFIAAIYSHFSQSIFLWAAFLPSTAIMAIFLACPLAVSRRVWAMALVSAVALLAAINHWAYFAERSKEDWRAAAATVADLPLASHRLIIFCANEAQLPFDYYYQRSPMDTETGVPAGFFDRDPPVTQLRVISNADLSNLRDQLSSNRFDQIVLVSAHENYADPAGLTLAYLQNSLVEWERTDLRGITIRVFRRR